MPSKVGLKSYLQISLAYATNPASQAPSYGYEKGAGNAQSATSSPQPFKTGQQQPHGGPPLHR
jgi:hypothetical protein